MSSKELDLILKDGFLAIERSVFEKVLSINETLSKTLEDILNEPLKSLKTQNETNIKMIKEFSKNKEVDEVQKAQNIIAINDNIEKLQKYMNEVTR